MKVKDFIEQFVEPNTLIRLWYKFEGGHAEVISGDKPQMEWELIKSKYANRIVVGVTDILYGHSPYIEAVNLTIEREQYADKQVNPKFYETVTLNPCAEVKLTLEPLEDIIEHFHKKLIEISKIPSDRFDKNPCVEILSTGGCPVCGAEEVEASSPRTVYACGSSDYDQRPGTFKQGENCKSK